MQTYNYEDTVREDIREYILENIDQYHYSDRDDLESQLNDDFWTEDSVTGNGSGSYTFDRAKAKEYLFGDPKAVDYVKDLCDEYGLEASTVGEHFMEEDWEYFDVSIRCYIMGWILGEVLDEIYGKEIPDEN